MHPEELLKPDLLSEIVLLTFGTLALSSLVLFVVAALARAIASIRKGRPDARDRSIVNHPLGGVAGQRPFDTVGRP